MPLAHHMAGCHGEREPGVAILPHAVRDPLAMAEDRRIADEQRTMIAHLLRERISLRGICRAVGVSLTWLLHFMVECFRAYPDD